MYHVRQALSNLAYETRLGQRVVKLQRQMQRLKARS